MRKRFEVQLVIGQKPIEDVEVNLKCRDALPKLIRALKELFLTPKYSEVIFAILEERITKDLKKTGRNGMNLWTLFVLAQTRCCLNISYDRLHDYANNHSTLRHLMGIETQYGFKRIEVEYQTIIDNITLLDDATILKINDIIVGLGHDVFKKKETGVLNLKTDSFVVESNVHFPTDYNLLYDSGRKCADIIGKFLKKYETIEGWRKLDYWYKELKNKMRSLGLVLKSGGKTKDERAKQAAEEYIDKAKLFSKKIDNERDSLPINGNMDLSLHIELDYYKSMLDKHIDLVERRILNDEKIPHWEKVFSIFESYTEWLTKGKEHPNVELGKNVQITTDQFNLIVDYKIMEQEVDKSSVISLGDRILQKYKVGSWSFDKGFYTKENKEILGLFINEIIMPKKGKLNQTEKEEEHTRRFKKIRNKHSAVESNINELEHRGLDRCPDKGKAHFQRYVGLGICAYNLHRIGARLIKQDKQKQNIRIAA